MSAQIWLPLIGAVLAWVLTEWRKLWWEQYQRKTKIYEELLRASRGFYEATADIQKKRAFLELADSCWLYCNDDVVTRMLTFLETVATGPGTTAEQRRIAFAQLVVALRKDVFAWGQPWRTKLKSADYRLYGATTDSSSNSSSSPSGA